MKLPVVGLARKTAPQCQGGTVARDTDHSGRAVSTRISSFPLFTQSRQPSSSSQHRDSLITSRTLTDVRSFVIHNQDQVHPPCRVCILLLTLSMALPLTACIRVGSHPTTLATYSGNDPNVCDWIAYMKPASKHYKQLRTCHKACDSRPLCLESTAERSVKPTLAYSRPSLLVQYSFSTVARVNCSYISI
jgi:hypothetical protein